MSSFTVGQMDVGNNKGKGHFFPLPRLLDVAAEDGSRLGPTVILPECNATGSAASQGRVFGFCFHAVEMARPVSGLQEWSSTKKSVLSTSNRRLQD